LRSLATLNNGFVFGFLDSNSGAITLSFLAMILVVLFVYQKKISVLTGFLFILGATSNILDRIFYGGVVDYLQLFHISKFNLADVLIVGGLCLGILQSFGKNPKEHTVV
jgi:lipoprotein signal peptidase